MPQMNPMNWIILFIYFIYLFYLFILFIYFNNLTFNSNLNLNKKSNKTFLSWKW